MKTIYTWITFVPIRTDTCKTSIWRCCNNRIGDQIGVVKWYGRWRQYCYFPDGNTVYSQGCLSDIAEFIQQLMELRK